jgi:nucleoporin NUP2
VLNKSDSNIFGPPAPSTLSSSSNKPATADEDDPVFQYYINLRGLNHSLLNTISKGIEDDPFADMSGILESYKSTYLRIVKEKDDASTTASKPESSSNSSTFKSSPSNFFSMPPAPSPFGKPPTQSSLSTSGVSFTPLFSQPSAGVQPLRFPPSSGSQTFSSSNETAPQSLFGVSTQKFFSPPEQTSSTTTTSTFGSTSSPFKFGGSSSTTNQSSPSIFGSSTPASTFKWGVGTEPSTGNVIGASDNSSTTTSTPTPATNDTVHFQFGSGSSDIPQKTAVSADEKTADDAADGEGSEQVTSTTEGGGESSGSPSNLLATHNPHDDEGEGEENEISVHAIKVKAYRMKKPDAKGGPGWADLGFGERSC